MDNIKLIEEIKKYYMNPKKYPNEYKEEVEDAINRINKSLLENATESDDLITTLFEKYTSEDLNAPINSTIYKTRADEQGFSATRGYKNTYFNEIIQNANDNTNADLLEVIVSKEKDMYELIFEYQDKGFSMENIVGFFDTEIHTKRDNLAATGKHGVGIKSLFYFVDYMKIESNVQIEIKIETIIEEENSQKIEKVKEVRCALERNSDWYNIEDKKTRFIIRFPEKEAYGIYNIEKLKSFINICMQDQPIDWKMLEKFFYNSSNSDEMIFDIRSLLFTDKNKGKLKGIKRIVFYKQNKERLFDICIEEKEKFEKKNFKLKDKVKQYKGSLVELFCAGESVNSYTVITEEADEEKQNFSVAFPKVLAKDYTRYYETYYLAEEEEYGINLLINSMYSNIARTKLSEDDKEKSAIKKRIAELIIGVYHFLTSINFSQLDISMEWKKIISIVFHRRLNLEDDFISMCYEEGINNRYLVKFRDANDEDKSLKYIVYKREEKKERFEIKTISQEFSVENSIKFFNQYILREDSLTYDNKAFLQEICSLYDRAFQPSSSEINSQLKTVLNVAGNVRDFIYYRIVKIFPMQDGEKLSDQQVDEWTKKIWEQEKQRDLNTKKEQIKIALALLGRYELHSKINYDGDITGASFYEYLFSKMEKGSEVVYDEDYPTFKSKQKELFAEQYGPLRTRLLRLLVNENDGIVEFKASDHHFAKESVRLDLSKDNRVISRHNSINENDANSFGTKYLKLLIQLILTENKMKEHIITTPYTGGWGNILTIFHSNNYWADDKLRKRTIELGNPDGKSFSTYSARLINIEFLRQIYASSWEDFKYFLECFLETQNKDGGIVKKYKGFSLYTVNKEGNPMFSLKVDELNTVFRFFYQNMRFENSHDVRNDWSKYQFRFQFKVNLVGELDIENNLCPPDFHEYLKQLIGKKVYVLQANRVNNMKEIMLWFENKFWFYRNGEWTPMGKGSRSEQDEIIIVHNDRLDYKEAIKKSIEQIREHLSERRDFLDKFDAFISEEQNYSIQGELYDEIRSNNLQPDLRCQKEFEISNNKELSVQKLIKIITARGNNDDTCCCCGKKLTEKKLIITNNANEQTNEDYPQIVEVACGKCRNILEKSHKCTELYKEENGYRLKYICDVNNSHQKKEVVFNSWVPEGLLSLWRAKK